MFLDETIKNVKCIVENTIEFDNAGFFFSWTIYTVFYSLIHHFGIIYDMKSEICPRPGFVDQNPF